jgi:hypothetical protein
MSQSWAGASAAVAEKIAGLVVRDISIVSGTGEFQTPRSWTGQGRRVAPSLLSDRGGASSHFLFPA